MADVQTDDLYERDIQEWTLDQVRALRVLRDAAAGQGDVTAALHGLDWDNLIEELEGLAGRDRRELLSCVLTIIEHLLKLQFSPVPEPRVGWRETIGRSRTEISLLLRQSPSLRREMAVFLTSDFPLKTARQVSRALTDRDEITASVIPHLTGTTYTESEILEDWWPDQQEETSK